MPLVNPTPQEIRRIADTVLNDEVCGLHFYSKHDLEACLYFGYADIVVYNAPRPDKISPERWYAHQLRATKDRPHEAPTIIRTLGPYINVPTAFRAAEMLQQDYERPSRILVPFTIDHTKAIRNE